MVLKVLKGAAAAAALWSCQALSAARSIIQSWVLVNAFCQPEELRGSDGAPVVRTDTVACRSLYSRIAGGALQRLTPRPTCDFRLTGSPLRLVIMCVFGGSGSSCATTGGDGRRRVTSFRVGDI